MSKMVTIGSPVLPPLPPFLLRGEPEGFEPGEREAMTEGLKGLISILSWARPHGTQAELDFMLQKVLAPIREAGRLPQIDGFGNVWVHIPSAGLGPCVLWSCHVDTVHSAKADRRQAVRYMEDGRTIGLANKKPGRCLGADDGAGVWLLLEMLKEGVPGGYVFHRGEECGRLGSEYVAKQEPERLKDYDACVAFDRRDYADFITHQMGMRCASDTFAKGMSAALNAGGMDYRPDDGGSYTDSYSYAELVSECANVSVGYDREHGPNETLDGLHVWRLREALLSADFSSVICERDPSEYEDMWGYGVPYGHGSSYSSHSYGAKKHVSSVMDRNAWGVDFEDKEEEREALIDLIQRYPRAVADLLGCYGMGCEELLEQMNDSELAGALPRVAGGWNHD